MQLLPSRGAQKTVLLVLCFYTDLAGLPSGLTLCEWSMVRIKHPPLFPDQPHHEEVFTWVKILPGMFHSIRISRIYWKKKKIDIALVFSHPPGKEGSSLFCLETLHPWGMLGHLLNTFPNQPCRSVGSAWLAVLATTVNSDDKSLPAGAVRSQGGWPVHTLILPRWLGRHVWGLSLY